MGIPIRVLLIKDSFDIAELVLHEFKWGSRKKYGTRPSICKDIVKAHDGYIRVEGKYGEGNNVRFSLPVLPGEGEIG